MGRYKADCGSEGDGDAVAAQAVRRRGGRRPWTKNRRLVVECDGVGDRKKEKAEKRENKIQLQGISTRSIRVTPARRRSNHLDPHVDTLMSAHPDHLTAVVTLSLAVAIHSQPCA